MCNLISMCERIADDNSCELKLASARELTTFKGGGSAYVFAPDSEQKFVRVYTALRQCGYTPFVLGGGSNTIIADGVCDVPIISTLGMDSVVAGEGKVYAECGARLLDVTAAFRKQGLGGLEFLSGVPATVGGAVHMNASAFSAQTADYIDEIRILSVNYDKNLFEIKNVPKSATVFGYRKGVAGTVIGATFVGDKICAQASIEKAREYAGYRRARQPRQPSCGSVFKNGEVPSGKLIEECGLKGAREGGAQISEMHGNFIVNTGGATASDFMTLVRLCESEVMRKFGVTLEREFVYLE